MLNRLTLTLTEKYSHVAFILAVFLYLFQNPMDADKMEQYQLEIMGGSVASYIYNILNDLQGPNRPPSSTKYITGSALSLSLDNNTAFSTIICLSLSLVTNDS